MRARGAWLVSLVAVAALVGTYFWQHSDVASSQRQANSLATKVARLSAKNALESAEIARLTAEVQPVVYHARAACQASQLVLSEDGNSQSGLANRAALFSVTNTSTVDCVLEGYPTFDLRQADGAPTPPNGETSPTVDRGNMFTNDPGAHLVDLPAGASAYFSVGWFATGLSSSPAKIAYVAVYMPGATAPLFAAVHDFSDWASTSEITAIAPLAKFNTASLQTQLDLSER